MPDDPVIYYVDGSDADGKSKEGDDLREEVRIRVGDFLSAMTQQAITSEKNLDARDNRYSLKEGSVLFRLTDDLGNPSPITVGSNGANEKFVDPSDNPAFDNISDSGIIFTPSVDDFVQKGVTGHDILKEIQAVGVDPHGRSTVPVIENNEIPIVKQVSTVLKKNRFDPGPDTPFVPETLTSDTVDDRAFAGRQRSFGAYSPDDVEITHEQLRKVGLSLMLRATGELIEGDPSGLSAASNLAPLVPGAAQVGQRIDAVNLQAASLSEEQGMPDKIKLGSDLVLIDRQRSYGSLNSFVEPFAGFAPIGMTFLATALSVALYAALQATATMLANVASTEKLTGGLFGNTSNKTVLDKGKSKHQGSGFIAAAEFGLSAIGVQATKHDFGESFQQGLAVFFGVPLARSAANIVTGIALNEDSTRVLQSPGYYVVVTRSVLRSADTLAGFTSGIVQAFSNANITGGIQSTLGLVDVLKGSKIVGFVNVMAQIGDRSLDILDLGFNPNETDISNVDFLPDNPMTHVMKSRTGPGGRNAPLAWRTSGLAGAYLLPNNVKRASSLLGGNQDPSALATVSKGDATRNSKIVSDSELVGGRISPEIVSAVEKDLDLEYMPFYFHDLRTNEIVAFHAFLEDIGDNYNANYENVDAYGRVDPVRIYKNTVREVSLTFNIVSTNSSDFDEMWAKINKLSTLVYPQYSSGREVTDGERRFVQPFSQIVSSSPLIRLRLGDLFRTNYSKFGLARLFGLGTKRFNVSTDINNADLTQLDDETLQRLDVESQKIADRMRADPLDTLRIPSGFLPGELAEITPGNYARVDSPIDPFAGTRARDLEIQGTEVVRVLAVKASPNVSQFLNNLNLDSQKSRDNSQTVYTVQFENSSGLGEKIDVEHSRLQIHGPEVVKLAGRVVGLPQEIFSTAPQDVADFFNDENNAIVRSFRSTQGKGLGGVITNMSFDWNSGRWNTDKFGSRAPMWCKVQMSFAPIHDISPGLDNDGFNRAPIYNVGSVMNAMSEDDNITNDTSSRDNFAEIQRRISEKLRRE